jgi:hypothetical protein
VFEVDNKISNIIDEQKNLNLSTIFSNDIVDSIVTNDKIIDQKQIKPLNKIQIE